MKMTVHLCCFNFLLRQRKKVEDGGENVDTTSVNASDADKEKNCIDKSPTSQQLLPNGVNT